jgi:hypothetical protein
MNHFIIPPFDTTHFPFSTENVSLSKKREKYNSVTKLTSEKAVRVIKMLTKGGMKMAVFWDVAPYSLVEVYRLTNISEVLAASIVRAMSIHEYETSVNIYQTTRRTHPRRQSSSYSPP